MTACVETPDLTFHAECFQRQWQECITHRPHYIYLLPPADGDVFVYFSRSPWQETDIALLCSGSEEPLERRWDKGEEPVGFRLPLSNVTLKARTAHGRALLQEIGYRKEPVYA